MDSRDTAKRIVILPLRSGRKALTSLKGLADLPLARFSLILSGSPTEDLRAAVADLRIKVHSGNHPGNGPTCRPWLGITTAFYRLRAVVSWGPSKSHREGPIETQPG